MNFSHIFQPVPSRDWLIVAVLFFGITLVIGLAELLRRKEIWSAEFNRKLVHVMVGLLTVSTPAILQTSLPLLLIGALFTVANAVAIKTGKLKGMHGSRESYGTIFYPFSFFLLVLLAWQNYKVIIIAAMAILAFGDAAAAIVGESRKKPHRFVLIDEPKSLEGSAAMFLVSAICIATVLALQGGSAAVPPLSPGDILWIALVVAAIATVAEALSHYGSDNISVPLFTGLILYYMLSHDTQQNILFTLGVLLGGVAAYLSYRWKALSLSGAAAMFLLACLIFGFGGWKWTVPILTFFVLSTLLSKLGKSSKAHLDQVFDKGSRRDYAQVFANGGIAGIMMILYMFFESPQMYIFYLAALSAATADTWATEIGTLSRRTPRKLTTWEPVPTGTSGGVTPVGFIGAFAGALILPLSGWFFLESSGITERGWLILLIAISGFMASVVDSFLGATVQVQFRCPECEMITEKKIHCGNHPTTAISGIQWMNNDMVNLLNTLSAVLFIYWGIYFFV